MRIINTTAFGWLDMNHVLRVTPVAHEDNPHGKGGYMQFGVYMMMRDKPFIWQGSYDPSDEATPAQIEEANEAVHSFILAWRSK